MRGKSVSQNSIENYPATAVDTMPQRREEIVCSMESPSERREMNVLVAKKDRSVTALLFSSLCALLKLKEGKKIT